jgi:DHA2 family multidrug resistance protein
MTRAISAAAVYLMVFTQMLDTSVANLALPRIATDLHMDLFQASLVTTTFGTGLVVAFSLGTLLSRRISPDLVLTLGCITFLASSYGCGSAVRADVFLACRLFQGLGSGMAAVVAQGLLLRTLGEANRGLAIALWTSAVSLAPLCGPIVGAYVTDFYSWRWLFLLNVPLLATAWLLLARTLDFSPPAERERGYRPLGTLAAFAAAVVCMQYVLDFGQSYGWLADPRIRAGAAGAVLAAGLFLVLNDRAGASIFDLRIFRDRTFAAALPVLCLGNGILFTSILLFGIWLQVDYGLPLAKCGLILAVASGISGLASPFVGKFLPPRMHPAAALVSLVASGLSFWMMAQFTLDTSRQALVMSRVVAGIGLAVFTVPLTSIALSTIAAEKVVNAYAVIMTLRILSSNFFVAAGFVLLERSVWARRDAVLAAWDRGSALKADPAVAATMQAYLDGRVSTDAFTGLAFHGAWFFAAAVVLLLVIAVMRARRRVVLPAEA